MNFLSRFFLLWIFALEKLSLDDLEDLEGLEYLEDLEDLEDFEDLENLEDLYLGHQVCKQRS